jgi:putative transposase
MYADQGIAHAEPMTAPQQKPAGHRGLRRGRVSMPGHVYFITSVCAGRTCRFAGHDVACAASAVVAGADSWHDATVLAWVLMPDHLHLLLELGLQHTLQGVMQRGKSLIARAAHAAAGTQGEFWQPAFHDRALRRDEDVRAAARYLIANPLRAGLVERMGDYPYWDAQWL